LIARECSPTIVPAAPFRVLGQTTDLPTMKRTLTLTGDVNLMKVDDPTVPFRRVADEIRASDVVFGNLECCLYRPAAHSLENEGFHADPTAGEALRLAGFHAVGNANNVNFGTDAILGSNRRLDELGILHTGTGANLAAARAPALVVHKGLSVGFLQRTSVYWTNGHAATDHTPGVAVIQGHTAYQPPFHKLRPDIPPANRPGVPPIILTWADRTSLDTYLADLDALRAKADIVVSSHHWGLYADVLDYQIEIAHAAIDRGADVVVGHGPHMTCGIEVYKGRPIFYGVGNLCFHSGHGDIQHGDWVGMVAHLGFDDRALTRAAIRLVRHNAANETYFCDLATDTDAIATVTGRCHRFGTRLAVEGDELVIALG
jgi:poly-gamma-glutamate synthesis protein (capsule biosynthesis protein)